MNIVYEDKDFLVINKPPGLLVHPAESTKDEITLVDMLKEYFPDIENVGEDLSRPGIVHRLDRDSSGLLVVAKNNESFQYLKNLFQERKIEKKYYALVYGHPKEKEGTIEAPIAKLEGKQTTRLGGKKQLEGKTATTEYKVLKEIKDYSLLDVSIKTGRTHQIRVHLKSIGHPIVCDKLYKTKAQECPSFFKRMFLHAYFLSFKSPSGNPIILEADLPEDLAQGLEKL